MPRNKKVAKALTKELKSDVIDAAVKVATKQSSATKQGEIINEKMLTAKQKDIRNYCRHFLTYKLEMSEQEFLNAVSDKLSSLVSDSLNMLHDKLDDIPPQNLPYALSILFDKMMTIKGRPTNITASANVKLGSSDMTPEQMRSLLKKATNPQDAEVIET